MAQSNFPAAAPPLPLRHSPVADLADNVLEELWFGDDDPKRTHLEASRTMAAVAAESAGLKPFPAVAQQVLSLLSDPDVSVAAVREEIEQDASLAARLLRVSNSALYRPAVPISGIDQAVVRLGWRSVREIVSGIAAMGMFDDSTGIGVNFRNHCGGVAAVVRVLGMEWGQGGAGDLFLCGLLHDIGKLLSLQVAEVPYEEVPPEVLESPDRVHLWEREVNGYDHAVLGAHVLELWKLPAEVAKVVAWHHQPGRAFEEGGDLGLKVALLRLADRIEYKLRESTELDEAFIDEVARESDCTYVGVSRDVLAAKWPKIVEAYGEVATLIA